MKNFKLNKSILLMVIFAIIMGISVISFADDDTMVILPNGTTSTPTNTSANTTANTTTTNTNTATNVQNSITSTNKVNNTTNKTNNTTSSYNNTNLPKTGVSDYKGLFIVIGIVAIIAIVAYKKSNYYKNV